MEDSGTAALPGRRGKPWSEEEDRLLYDSFIAGQPLETLASVHQRGQGGIRSRLQRLRLIDQFGEIIDPPPPFSAPKPRRQKTVRAEEEVMKVAFAVTAPDGWQLEIRSNRALDRPLAERLDLMLKGVLDGPSQ